AVDLGEAHGVWNRAALAAVNLGAMLARAGRLTEAEVAFRWAVDLGETHGMWIRAAMAAVNLGLILAQAGRLPEAEAVFRRAIDLGAAHGVWDEATKAAFSLGVILAQAGHLPEAEAAYRRAMDLGEAHGVWDGAAQAASNLGGLLAHARRLPAAKAVLHRAEAAARRARFSALDTAWAAPLVIALIEPVSAQGHAVRAVPNLTHLESEAAAAPEAPSPADWAALCLERARARLHSAVYDTTVTRADFAAVQADLATAARWLTEANPGANANLRVAQILLDSLYDTNHDIPAAWRAATVKGTLEALTHAVAHEAEAEGARDLGDTDPLVEIAQAAAELALWVLWRTGQPEASPAIVRQVVELLAPSFAHDPAGLPTAIVALATLTLARLARLLRTDDSGLL
ncbi:MAG: tetratricopeptide repeat protein, partial [Myxococcales bacterium]|nr:tetratricopeptide repeat protein [Myxococcales bacterium]